MFDPIITDPAWEAWYQFTLAERITYCTNYTNSSEYHFASNGNDLLGDGSITAPFYSVAKAQQLIDASNGHITIKFKSGDTFHSLTGIDTGIKNNVIITRYDDGPRPKITTFLPLTDLSYNGMVRVQTMPQTVTWVKSTDPLIRGSNYNFVISTPESWFFDNNTNILYVNSVHPDLEYTQPTSHGIIIRGDKNLIEGLEVEGFGMQLTTPSQQHGLEIRTTANRQACIINSKSSYGSSHVITHLGVDNQFGPNAYGGVATFVGCEAAWATKNSAGETLFNTFSLHGQQDVIFDTCQVIHGTLPSDNWNYSYDKGIGFYGHTGGSIPMFRVIANNCFVDNCEIGIMFNDLPPTEDLNSAKSVINKCTINSYTNPLVMNYLVVNKCILNLTPPRFAYSLANFVQNGWCINSQVNLDLSSSDYYFALFNNPPNTPTSPEFIHNTFTVNNTGSNAIFNLDYDTPIQSFNGKFENNAIILTSSNPNLTMGGINNNAYINTVSNNDNNAIINPVTLLCTTNSNILTSINMNTLPGRKCVGAVEDYQPADINHDFMVDFFDYLDFVDAFSNNSSEADFNNDSFIDFFDYLDFTSSLSTSC